jgi:hypothetical protein
MSNNLHAVNPGIAASGNDRLKLVESPGSVEPSRVLADRDPKRSPDARPKPEGTAPRLSEEMRRSIKREVTPDLHRHCPICGTPYQPGEGVLALACLSFAASTVPSSPAAGDCDPSSKLILGHRGCVLPRLLTLLASFQPEHRFVKASRDFSAGESAFPERHHDEP